MLRFWPNTNNDSIYSQDSDTGYNAQYISGHL